MKIGQPINKHDVPGIDTVAGRRSQYSHVWDSVKTLKAGQLLPIECADRAEAEKLYKAATNAGRNGSPFLGVKRRDLTVYLYTKETVG